MSKTRNPKGIGLDAKTFDDLDGICKKNYRSKRDQIRKWIAEELQEQELDKYTEAVSLNINKRNQERGREQA
tara:strand:- start:544 stop:759 length:216 start_codon:yes stop_codon:yes gene_type:complete